MEKVGRQTLGVLPSFLYLTGGAFPFLFKTAIDFCGLVE